MTDEGAHLAASFNGPTRAEKRATARAAPPYFCAMLIIEDSSDSSDDCPTDDVAEMPNCTFVADACTYVSDAEDKEAASKLIMVSYESAKWARAETPVAADEVVRATAIIPTKRKPPRTEWDKLTKPWFTNTVDVAHSSHRLRHQDTARPSHQTPRTKKTAQRKRRRASVAEASEPTSTITRSSAAPSSGVMLAPPPSRDRGRERTTQRTWRGGDYVDAKYLAQQVGSACARWYPGRIVGVSDDGLFYDVLFEDGDYEEAVPVRYVRASRKVPPEAVLNSQACDDRGLKLSSASSEATTVSAPTASDRVQEAASCLLQFACEPHVREIGGP